MSIKISLSSSDPLGTAADVAVIGISEGAKKNAALTALTKALGPVVARTLKREDFTGKKDQQVELVTNGSLKAARVVLVGLGNGPITEAQVRVLAARGARSAQSSRATSLVIEIPELASGTAAGAAERAAAEGVVLGAYRFTKYMTGDRVPKASLERVTLATSSKLTPELRAAVAAGEAVGESIGIARDLVNEPPNELYPEAFASFCKTLCAAKGLPCKVLDKEALAAKGLKLMLAVGQGSAHESRLIHMAYVPASGKATKRIVFVGKGLTFDSGGLCIKPAAGMEEMKGDMGGGANVTALMSAIATLKPDVEVHGLIGAVENMPDGAAYRPGDIFGSLDGKSVEIINTDAEGRLVLADVLAYARELKPDLIVDNATLTGAIIVALGPTTSGFYANREELGELMKSCAKAAGESMWQMPLLDELRDGLKSDWADLKHTADRWGGSITAALFLREFVGDVPWVHVDIAGPSMYHRASGIHGKGGTGHGVLTFLKLIESMGKEPASQLADIGGLMPGGGGRAASAPSAQAIVAPVKRGPGRPRKHPLPTQAAPEKPPVAAPPAPETPKRKPGRPRKHPLPTAPAPQATPAPETPKRKPGRPRKHPLPSAPPASAAPVPMAAAPKKRGRPRKHPLPVVPAVAVPAKRGPGRPRKHPLPVAPAATVPAKRGPGRPRKHPLPATPARPKLPELKRPARGGVAAELSGLRAALLGEQAPTGARKRK